MKYLLTYAYGGKVNNMQTSGTGSMVVTASGNKITEKMIFDKENGAISIVKEQLEIEGIKDVKVVVMGFFKFDEDQEGGAI